MNENSLETIASDDEIDLLDLFAVLLRRKWLIISITIACAVGSVIFAAGSLLLPPEKSYMPNLYTPQALMLINDASSSGGLSSMLNSSGLGGLASLAGISVQKESSNSGLAVYLVETNTFLDSVVDEFDLVTRYKIKKYLKAESRKALKKNLTAKFDDKSGVFSISFTDLDPAFAQRVVNYAVSYLENRFNEMGIDKNKLSKENLEANIKNTYDEILRLEGESAKLDQASARGLYSINGSSLVLEATRLNRELDAQAEIYKQLKTQYELLKVQMASETPIFQVLEYAEVPDQKSKPSRGMLCIVATFAGFFMAIFLAFLLNAVDNIKKDPVALNKLKGIKE